MISKQNYLKFQAARMRKLCQLDSFGGTRIQTWIKNVGWIELSVELSMEIRRQQRIVFERINRRFGKQDKLESKNEGEILHKQIAKKCHAKGEPAPIPKI